MCNHIQVEDREEWQSPLSGLDQDHLESFPLTVTTKGPNLTHTHWYHHPDCLSSTSSSCIEASLQEISKVYMSLVGKHHPLAARWRDHQSRSPPVQNLQEYSPL